MVRTFDFIIPKNSQVAPSKLFLKLYKQGMRFPMMLSKQDTVNDLSEMEREVLVNFSDLLSIKVAKDFPVDEDEDDEDYDDEEDFDEEDFDDEEDYDDDEDFDDEEEFEEEDSFSEVLIHCC
jgi:hypothetical protein